MADEAKKAESSWWVKLLTHLGAFAAGVTAGWVANDAVREAETQSLPPTNAAGK